MQIEKYLVPWEIFTGKLTAGDAMTRRLCSLMNGLDLFCSKQSYLWLADQCFRYGSILSTAPHTTNTPHCLYCTMENHLEKLIVKSVLLDMFTQHLIENMLLSF